MDNAALELVLRRSSPGHKLLAVVPLLLPNQEERWLQGALERLYTPTQSPLISAEKLSRVLEKWLTSSTRPWLVPYLWGSFLKVSSTGIAEARQRAGEHILPLLLENTPPGFLHRVVPAKKVTVRIWKEMCVAEVIRKDPLAGVLKLRRLGFPLPPLEDRFTSTLSLCCLPLWRLLPQCLALSPSQSTLLPLALSRGLLPAPAVDPDLLQWACAHTTLWPFAEALVAHGHSLHKVSSSGKTPLQTLDEFVALLKENAIPPFLARMQALGQLEQMSTSVASAPARPRRSL